MTLVTLSQLGADKLGRRALDQLSGEAQTQGRCRGLVAGDQPGFHKGRADGHVGAGVGQTLINRAGRMTNLEPQVPQHVEHELDELRVARRGFAVEQKQQIHIGEWRQLTPAVAAHGDHRQRSDIAFMGSRIMERSDDAIDQATESGRRIST